MIPGAQPVAWVILPLAMAGLMLAGPRPAPMGEGKSVTITIEADDFAFNPARIEVAEGDIVTLVLRSRDYVHGLHLEGYDLELTADPGRPSTLTFVADRPGTFRFRCSVPCGPLHPFMTGRLQVGPSAFPLAVLLAAAAAVAGGVLAVLRRPNANPAPP